MTRLCHATELLDSEEKKIHCAMLQFTVEVNK